jgi:DNA-binding MarR family transcriptional regulator
VRFDTPPPEPLASAPGFLISWNGHRMAALFAAALEPLGLRPPHFGVMTLIESHPGSTQQELVTESLIDASSMVAIIDELESAGLAERRPNESDRRKHSVYLTKRGRTTLGRARKVAGKTVEDVLAPLNERERETLRKLLRKLARAED